MTICDDAPNEPWGTPVCRPGAYLTAAVAVGALATSVVTGTLIGWAAVVLERRWCR